MQLATLETCIGLGTNPNCIEKQNEYVVSASLSIFG